MVYLPAVALLADSLPRLVRRSGAFHVAGEIVRPGRGELFWDADLLGGQFLHALAESSWAHSTLVTLGMVRFLMALGMGISVINGMAVLEGLFGRKNSEFVRTAQIRFGDGDR